MATVHIEVVIALQEKHPAEADNPFGLTEGPGSGKILSEEDIIAAFNILKPDTSSDLSGRTPHLLATALRVPAILKAVHKLTGLVMAEAAPGQAMLCASRLHTIVQVGWRSPPHCSRRHDLQAGDPSRLSGTPTDVTSCTSLVTSTKVGSNQWEGQSNALLKAPWTDRTTISPHSTLTLSTLSTDGT